MAEKIKIMLKNGKEQSVDKRFAKALVHVGKAIYVSEYEQKVIVAKDKEVKAKTSKVAAEEKDPKATKEKKPRTPRKAKEDANKVEVAE